MVSRSRSCGAPGKAARPSTLSRRAIFRPQPQRGRRWHRIIMFGAEFGFSGIQSIVLGIGYEILINQRQEMSIGIG